MANAISSSRLSIGRSFSAQFMPGAPQVVPAARRLARSEGAAPMSDSELCRKIMPEIAVGHEADLRVAAVRHGIARIGVEAGGRPSFREDPFRHGGGD